MIPQRMPANDVTSGGLRDRVAACRKRLRENRVTCRTHATVAVEELFPETHAAGFHNFAASESESVASPSLVGMSCSTFDGVARIEEQEVAIT